MIASVSRQLGHGIYTPDEVAFYVRERTQTINRWLSGNKTGRAVVQRQFKDEDRFVSFLDFIQSLAIASIRRQFKVPLQTLRQAVDQARLRHRIEYPFAMKHTTFLLRRMEKGEIEETKKTSDSEDLPDRLFEVFIKLKDESLVQLTGKHRGNYAINEVLELYLSDVSFNATTGLAEEYRPWTKNGLHITMNPQRRFGEPLTPSGYTASTLWEAVKAEGSIEKAAEVYGVDRKEVELACSYLDHLTIPTACA